jgi:hypothetical protein
LEARLQRLRDHNTFSDFYGATADELSQKQLAVNLAKEGLDTVLSTLHTLDAEVKSAAEALEKPLPSSFIAGLAAGGVRNHSCDWRRDHQRGEGCRQFGEFCGGQIV